MQQLNHRPNNSVRVPTLLVHSLESGEVAVRFWNIGGRQQFMVLLQRFCSEFLLARPLKIDNLDWLLVTLAQREAVSSFCQRYGLHIVEEA